MLFLNLIDEDWVDLGITNKFHIKKLQLILRTYRARYKRRVEKKRDLEEEDDVSDVAPSEVSDILEAESHSSEEDDENVGDLK